VIYVKVIYFFTFASSALSLN